MMGFLWQTRHRCHAAELRPHGSPRLLPAHRWDQSKGETHFSIQKPALCDRRKVFAAGQGVWLQQDTAVGI